MILVLCDEVDRSALWAVEALRWRGLWPTMLTGADFAAVERWQHKVGVEGADCEFSFPGGACVRGREIRGVLNRLPCVPSAWQRRIGGPDREYALQEMYAFYLSWLHALPCPKLNPPTPQGLCGNWRHPSVWVALAARVGLPVRQFRQSSDDDPGSLWKTPISSSDTTLYVIGTRLVGAAALVERYRSACLRLAKEAATPLLGITFMPDSTGRWQVTRVSIIPDLTLGGEELADALAAELAP